MTATRARPARAVDPRLQDRRRRVARREGLRRLWLVAALTAAASLAIGAIAASNSSWLDVEAVNVTGTNRANQQQVTTASGIGIGQPLVDVDTSEVEAAVSKVPWVAQADVTRSWRGAVTIEITERVATLALPAGSRFALVDGSGQQLEIVPSRPDGFLAVAGVEASGVPGQPVPSEGLMAAALIGQLSPQLAPLTTAVVIDDGQLQIELSSGGRANFGDERQLADKMVALETILARVDTSCLAVIDMRVPSAPTVRRTPTATGTNLEGKSGGETDNEEPLAGASGC